jgi:hypothetical protein
LYKILLVWLIFSHRLIATGLQTMCFAAKPSRGDVLNQTLFYAADAG